MQVDESVTTLRNEYEACKRAGLDVEWTTDIGLPFKDIKVRSMSNVDLISQSNTSL
jgi:hypothetical protein